MTVRGTFSREPSASGIPVPYTGNIRSAFIVGATELWSRHHFSPDGGRIVLPFAGEARVLDTESGETLLTLPGAVRTGNLEYGPLGRRIFAVAEEGLRIVVWSGQWREQRPGG